MPLPTMSILATATTKVCDIFETRGFENISITNDEDYLEINTEDREYKFPAIVLIGPKININKFVKGQGLYAPIIEINKEEMTYNQSKPPQIIDVIFELIILGETDQEVMSSILNIIDIFNDELIITINDVNYKVYLEEEPDIDNLTNYTNDLILARCSFKIEGLEIISPLDTTTTGDITEEIIIRPSANNTIII